jgi:hypothetical protein
VKPLGALIRAGSCESERCVFAMQTGRCPSSSRSNCSAWARQGRELDAGGAVSLRRDRFELARDGVLERIQTSRLPGWPGGRRGAAIRFCCRDRQNGIAIEPLRWRSRCGSRRS